MKRQRQTGFTIVELLIVIVVIGILAAITIVAYNGIQARANDARRDSDIKQLKTALAIYKSDTGLYPDACGSGTGCNVSNLASALVPGYLGKIPQDPNSATPYNYVRATSSDDSYGIRVSYQAKPTCKTGVNIVADWWGTTTPTC